MTEQSHRTDAAVGMWPGEGVVAVTESEQRSTMPGGKPSPTNDDLFRGAKVFTTMEEFKTWEDAFETDEEHSAFLDDLYESRRSDR